MSLLEHIKLEEIDLKKIKKEETIPKDTKTFKIQHQVGEVGIITRTHYWNTSDGIERHNYHTIIFDLNIAAECHLQSPLEKLGYIKGCIASRDYEQALKIHFGIRNYLKTIRK